MKIKPRVDKNFLALKEIQNQLNCYGVSYKTTQKGNIKIVQNGDNEHEARCALEDRDEQERRARSVCGLFDYCQENEIRDLLMYRKVVKIEGDTLLLDNGLKLYFEGNEGSDYNSESRYNVNELNGCDNAITNVEFNVADIDDPTSDNDTAYQIFVYAENKKIKLAEIDGTDGTGDYGTGYTIKVTNAEKEFTDEDRDYEIDEQ